MTTPDRPFAHPALLAALGLLLLHSACSGIGSFTIERQSDEKTVEGSLAGQLGNASPFANPFQFNINLERELEKRDADGAKRVALDDLVFTVTDDSDNFDFLDTIEVFADADGLDRKRIAWKDPVPEGKKEFSFEVDDGVNLKPYVEKGMKLQSEVEGSRPPEDRSFKAIIRLRIDTL